MMFLSGAAIPLEVLSDKIANFSIYLPLTHVVQLMRGLWYDGSWSDHIVNVLVLAGLLVVGSLVSIKTFRWE